MDDVPEDVMVVVLGILLDIGTVFVVNRSQYLEIIIAWDAHNT